MNFFKPKFWDKNQISLLSVLLFPISLLFQMLSFFKRSITKIHHPSIPIICVGNIYLGGTGKTPLCIEIFAILKNLNMNPAFVRKKYDSFQDEIDLQKRVGPIYQNKKRIEAVKEAIEKQTETFSTGTALVPYEPKAIEQVIDKQQREAAASLCCLSILQELKAFYFCRFFIELEYYVPT